ncbi:MAG: CaiB/BaiF CoA transferase family protein [Dethiobacteria bacterium]|jgi:CoA:oxalate CoA-transferase
MNNKTNNLPFENVTILAAEHFETAPICTCMLADLGANVIRVEKPGSGEGGRAMGPVFENKRGEKLSSFYFRFNHNKKSVAIDLKHPKGKELFLKLAEQADVVVENFRPGVMTKLGLGYEQLKQVKPDIIYATVTGFGHSDIYQSPYVDRPAFDLLAQAYSGLMYTVSNTDEPTWVGLPAGDHYGGVMAVLGIVSALYYRQLTGKGQHVDIAMYDCALHLNERRVNIYDVLGVKTNKMTNIGSAPYGPYKAKDGYIAISGGQPPVWPRFCKAVGREDLLEDVTLKSTQDRAKNYPRLRKIVEEWLKDKTREEALEIFYKFEVPAAPVHDEIDLFNCPHVKARKMIREYESDYSGRRRVVGNPIKLSLMTEKEPVPPPDVGEQTREVLRDMLNIPLPEIEQLKNEGIVYWKSEQE